MDTFTGTHRQAVTGRLYEYAATYEITGIRLLWRARVKLNGDLVGTPSGSIDIEDDIEDLAKESVTASVNSWINVMKQ